MPILTRLGRILLSVLALALMAGCDRGTPAYRHIKDLPYSEWDRYAESLPIEQVLDLQKEIWERSGHNPLMTIDHSFSKRPLEAYRSIVKRIEAGDTSRYYLGVIYDIDGSDGFKICAQADRKIVQGYLARITGYPEHWKYQPDFYNC